MNAHKNKGTQFEHLTALYLRTALADPDIDRAPLHGAMDVGDITGVRLPDGSPVVVECKDRQPLRLAEALSEAERERDAAHARYCMAVLHLKGVRAKSVEEMAGQLAVLPDDFWAGLSAAFEAVDTVPSPWPMGWPTVKRNILHVDELPLHGKAVGWGTLLPGTDRVAVATTLRMAVLAIAGGRLPGEEEPWAWTRA